MINPMLPLRLLIPLLLLVSSIIATTIGFCVYLPFTKSEIIDSHENELQTTLNILQITVQSLLKNHDTTTIDQQLNQINISHYRALVLTDAAGKLLTANNANLLGRHISQLPFLINHKNNPQLNQIKHNLQPGVYHFDHLLVGIAAIESANQPTNQSEIHYLVLVSDLTSDISVHQQQLFNRTMIFIGLIAIACLLLWFVFHLLISRRLQYLLEKTDQIANGQSDGTVILKGKDELVPKHKEDDRLWLI